MLTKLAREYLDHFYEARSHRTGSDAYHREMNAADWRWQKMTHAEREAAVRYMKGESSRDRWRRRRRR